MRPIHVLLIALAAVGCKPDSQHEVEAAQSKSSANQQHELNPPAAGPAKPAPTPPASKPLPPPVQTPPAPITSSDQSSATSDMSLLHDLQKEIANDAALSTAAKTVTIVTREGKVTLRGTVPTETEHTRLVELARKAAGEDAVDDQLQVQPN